MPDLTQTVATEEVVENVDHFPVVKRFLDVRPKRFEDITNNAVKQCPTSERSREPSGTSESHEDEDTFAGSAVSAILGDDASSEVVETPPVQEVIEVSKLSDDGGKPSESIEEATDGAVTLDDDGEGLRQEETEEEDFTRRRRRRRR